ncbi:hypothetical protein N7540_003530 [Penicillium herquei]|nr:hypothetical protein N7540_003530 [Penicillium herquei]
MIELRPDHFVSPLASLEVGPNGKKFFAPSGIIQGLRYRYRHSPDCIYVIDDDVEDIFGHILQFLHSGDYSVLVPASHESSHVECKHGIRGTMSDLLPLKENYFASHKDVEEMPENSISLPHCGDGDYLCKHPKTLLMHARLHAFALRHGLDRLEHVSLHKLYWTLSESPLDMQDVDAIIELLRLSDEMGAIDELMIHYVTLHLKSLMRSLTFILFLKENPYLSCRLLNYLCVSL